MVFRGTDAGGTLNSSVSVELSGTDGSLIALKQPSAATPGRTFLRGLSTLHFGSYGKTPLRWLYFLLGMMGAFLFYTGNLLWVESRRKHRKNRQPGKTWWMVRITIGVCIGCMAAVSFLLVMQKLLPLNSQPELYYFAAWAVCIIWACLRKPAQSAQELLLCTALITAMIPIADTAVTHKTLFSHALSGQWPSFAVELTALLMAWVFWQIRQAAVRRSRTGDRNSVWSIDAQ